MAQIYNGDGESVSHKEGGGLVFPGEIIKDSFAIPDTLKAQAGYTVYQITFKVAAKDTGGRSVIQELEILKRFTDLQNLSKQLEAVHSHSKSKVQFPSLVKAKYFERFKENVIEERKKSAKDMLYFVTHYPHLLNSTPIQHFIAGAKVKKTLFLDVVSTDIELPTDANSRIHGDNSLPSTQLNFPSKASETEVSIPEEEEGLSVGGTAPSVAAAISDKKPGGTNNPGTDDPIFPPAATSNSGTSSHIGSQEENLPLSDCNTSFENLEVDNSLDVKHAGKVAKSPSPDLISMDNVDVPDTSGKAAASDMSWWTDAMAETDNITEDLDDVVDKIEKKDAVDGGVVREGVNGGGKDRSSSMASKSQRPSRSGPRPNSGSPSPQQRRPSPSAKREAAYVVQAGRLISKALLYEKEGEWDEAFDLLKAGVDILLNGVQTDNDKGRRELVRRKTSEYLLYAENLQKQKISKTSGSGDPKPDQLLQIPIAAPPAAHRLGDFKVKNILGKVILVESKHTGDLYIFKVLHKSLKAMSAVPKGQSKAASNKSPLQCSHVVRLVQYYETQNHRIFLLLEYIKRGKLLEFVNTKREQWKRLREAATNPPPSSSLVTGAKQLDRRETDSHTSPPSTKQPNSELNGRNTDEDRSEGGDGSSDDKLEDSELDRMLSELTVPSYLPPKRISSSSENEEEDEEEEEEEDTLAIMRKRLEEYMLDEPAPSLDEDKDIHDGTEKDVQGDTSINVLPPTPTVSKNMMIGDRAQKDTVSMDSLSVKDSSFNSVEVLDLGGKNAVKSDNDSTDQDIFFSPASSRNSPDLKKVDDWVQRLEDNVRQWAAQIILGLEHLHKQNVICRNFHSGNVLLDEVGNAVLTYFGKWSFVEEKEDITAIKTLYMAPELQTLNEATEASDWWSLGAFLFELLTGKVLSSCYPGGVHSHLPLVIPVSLSSEAQSFLSQLLQVSPTERLGSGPAGVEELKAHPFFSGCNWTSLK